MRPVESLLRFSNQLCQTINDKGKPQSRQIPQNHLLFKSVAMTLLLFVNPTSVVSGADKLDLETAPIFYKHISYFIVLFTLKTKKF